jgi:hypothetical protein
MRLLVLALPVCLVLLVALLFGARWWLEGYLRSDKFRRFVDAQISRATHADAHLDGLHWEGSAVFSAGMDAVGNPGSPIGTLDAEQVHADLNLRALWRRVWRVDTIGCQRLRLTLPSSSAPATSAPPPPEDTTPAPQSGFLADWLPNRVEIGEVRVPDFSLRWAGDGPSNGGGCEQVEVIARPGADEHSWLITGTGGRLVQSGLPAIHLDEARLKTTPSAVFVDRISGQAEGGGKVDLSGRQELGGDRALDLSLTLTGVPIDRFLPPDWRARLQGLAFGQIHLTGSAGDRGSWRAHGHVDLREGHLEALPVLDQLAVFTTSASFRQTSLQTGGADFDWSPQRLSVNGMVLESSGLLRVEGSFVVQGGQIDGQFHLGVARPAMRWLAAAGSLVFTEPEHDGYLWTSLHLTGPVNNPHEDLTPRLAATIQKEAVDKARKSTDAVIDTASGLLDLLRTH